MKSNKEYIGEIYEKKNEILHSGEKNGFYNVEFRKTKNNSLKMIATFIITIGLTIGVGYAGITTYQDIWKEPKKYIFSSTQKLTEEEKNSCLSAEEANKIGTEYLRQVGLEDENITTQNLEKEFLSDENEWWMASKKASVTIDGKTRRIKITIST